MQIDTSKISKTTVNGLVSAAISVVIAIAALPPHLAIPVYILAGLRAYVGISQNDSKKDSQ